MKYDIAALKRKMLVKYPFFGSVVASVGYKENKDIPTAGTDGETIYYNPEYLEGLSVEEQTFIFAHEVCHIAFNHILRSEGKNPELWNIATDGVINQFLKRDGLKMAPGVVDMAEAINYDAEQLYEKLLQEKQQSGQGNSQQNQQGNQQQSSGGSQGGNNQQQPQSQQDNGETQNQESKQQSSDGGQSGDNQQQSQSPQQGNSGSGSSQEQKKQSQEQKKQSQEQSGGESGEDSQKEDKSKQDVGHDTHSMWEQAVKKHKEQQEKTDKKDKEKTELESMGEKDAFKKNLEDKKKQLEELKEAISKQASQAGTSTNRDIRTVNDIGTAKPLIDWRYVLREAIKYDVDWSYKNATIEDGVVSANLEEQPMPETEIVIDTSGSINEVLLKNFLRECKNILKHSRVKVGCFDDEFYGFHDIRTEKDIEEMKFEGYGGTDFNVAVNAFTKRVENKIIFTDGYAEMPSMPLNAIWIVFGNRKIYPNGGKVIYIDEKQFERVYNCKIKIKKKSIV